MNPKTLLFAFLLLPTASLAQTSQTGMAYDTLGNRTQRVIAPVPNQLRTVASVEKERTEGKTPIDIVPAEDSKTFKLIPRKYIPSDYEHALLSGEIFNTKKHLPVYNQNQSDNDTSALKQSLGLRDASLPVASIPYNASVSPSGGRIYSVPIRTAAGFDYVPQISLTYNSQGGPGTAGWGWEIAGLSSITLRGKTLYYDGVKAPVSRVDSLASYAIDGIPLVPNPNPELASEYPYESAQGHIQVRKNANGTFSVMRPDGSTAVYGIAGDTRPRVEWPIAYSNDINGNIIYYQYDYIGNDNIISAIYYGYGAGSAGAAGRLEFHYSVRADSTSRYVAGLKVSKTRRLQNVLTLDRNQIMATYALSYNMVDGVSENLGVNLWSDNQRINPLIFETRDSTFLPRFAERDSISRPSYLPTADTPTVYKRGKFIPGYFDDGMIAHEADISYAPGNPSNNWSGYSPWTYIFGMMVYGNSFGSISPLMTGSGFQTIDAVDVDSDGADELVKLNYTSYCTAGGVGLGITVDKYYDGYHHDVISSSAIIPGSFLNSGSYAPRDHLFLYGDFTGDGKIELLTITVIDDSIVPTDLSSYALIRNLDSATPSLSNNTLPFSVGAGNSSRFTALDIDGDGITEICYDTTSGAALEVYKYDGLAGRFKLYRTISTCGAHLLADGKYYLTDLNADGYPDFVLPPSVAHPDSTTWHVYEYTGETFAKRSMEITWAPDQNTMIMFMDANRDGYPDMVRISGTMCCTHRNINGTIYPSYDYNTLPDYPYSILPANIINYRGASQLVMAYEDCFKTYSFNDPAPPKHQIRRFYDSYGTLRTDYTADLSEHDLCSLDPDRSYDAANGYFRETLPLQVLEASTVSIPNGQPITNYTEVSHDVYSYKDPVLNSRGLGFCGFGETNVIHHATSNTTSGFIDFTRTVYDPEKRGVPIEQHSPGSAVFSTYDSHLDSHGLLSPRLITSVTCDSLNATVTTTNVRSYDRFDLPTASSTIYSRPLYDDLNNEWVYDQGLVEQWRDSTSTTYLHHLSTVKVVLGLPTETRQIRIHPTKGQWTRRTTVLYDTLGTGALFLPLETREYTGADGGQLVSTTRRTYSPVNFSGGFPGGRLLTETSAPYNATTFTGTTYTYSSDTSFPGRYVETVTDPLGRTTTYSNYDTFGHPCTVTDHKNRQSTSTYDIWGKLTSKTDIAGNVTTYAYAWASENGDRPAARNALIKTTVATAGHPATISYADALGRTVKSGEQRMDGLFLYTSAEYDNRGNITRKSLPYKTIYDSGVLWNTYAYDDYGRRTLYQEASGIQSTTAYPGAVQIPNAPSGQGGTAYDGTWQSGVTTVREGVTSTKAYDVLGNLLSASDAGGTIRYSYRPDGQLDTLIAPGGYLTLFTFDAFGRRTSITDPSVGTRSSSEVWAADGSVTRTETNDKGSVVTTWDRFGRKTAVTRTGPGAFDTAYTYSASDGGLLTAVTSTNGTSRSYTYDAYDRIVSETLNAPDSKSLVSSYTYASSSLGGRLSSVGYTALGKSYYTATNTYSSYGNYTGINGSVSISSENSLGQPTAVTTASASRGYYYDVYGRQCERTMSVPNGLGGQETVQDFTYDYYNTSHNIAMRADWVWTTWDEFTYDSLDRLASDDSTYPQYDSLGNITYLRGKQQQYASAGHPYRQTGGTIYGVVNRNQHITYTAYDRPYTIREGNRIATFTYNDAHERVKMQMCDTLGNTIYTRYYLGGCYDLEVVGSNTTENLYVGGDYYSAPIVWQRQNKSNTITGYNIGRDILGSVTLISDDLVPEYYSYDAWGWSRDYEDLNPFGYGEDPGFILHRGFGGHEYLPEFGLYNCNARLYDPYTGRFLSPDPYVQNPYSTQGLNRYSYCLNNPFKYSDPTGELFITTLLVTALVTGVVFGAGNVVAHALREEDLGHSKWLKYFGSGFIAGAAVGAIACCAFGGAGLLMESSIKALSIGGKILTYGMGTAIGIDASMFATSLISSAISGIKGDENQSNNHLKMAFSRFYYDENKKFGGEIIEGLSRYTWEYPQQLIGNVYSTIRVFNSDRVDYLGGATFITDENSGHRKGVTLGSYCNIDIDYEMTESFEYYVTKYDPIFMHEYGHTIDSKRTGLSYLFAVGIPSLISASNSKSIPGKYYSTHDAKPYERRANRLAEKYFGKHYGVSWKQIDLYDDSHYSATITIEDFYPL